MTSITRKAVQRCCIGERLSNIRRCMVKCMIDISTCLASTLLFLAACVDTPAPVPVALPQMPPYKEITIPCGMSQRTLKDVLVKLGYAQESHAQSRDPLADMLRGVQKAYKLSPTGIADDATCSLVKMKLNDVAQTAPPNRSIQTNLPPPVRLSPQDQPHPQEARKADTPPPSANSDAPPRERTKSPNLGSPTGLATSGPLQQVLVPHKPSVPPEDRQEEKVALAMRGPVPLVRPPPLEPPAAPKIPLVAGQAALAMEGVECVGRDEAFATFYSGAVTAVAEDGVGIQLGERFAVWFDRRREELSSESWECVPRRMLCYSSVKFNAWKGTRKREETAMFESATVIAGDADRTTVKEQVTKWILERCPSLR